MYPAQFDYRRASSVDEALALLREHGDAKLLAGGHSLIPMMKLRLAQPPTLIDIGRIAELRGIEKQGDRIRIGSLTTHAELAGSEVLAEHCPILAEAAGEIGDPQVRNRGTIGGNLAHADPGSDLPAVLLTLGGSVHTRGPGGERTIAAADFFLDLLSTDLKPDELLVAVEVPVHPARTGSAYLKFEHPASGYAVVGTAAWVSRGEDGQCSGAGLAFNGVTATPLEADVSALVGSGLDDDAIAAAVDAAVAADDPIGDVYASGEYRVHLAKVYGKRALKAARQRI